MLTAVFAAFASFASAAEIQGVLMDKACSTKAVQGGQAVADAHTRQCALAPACQKTGYGVYTSDGKYLTFDDAGNQKALAALKASKKTDNMKVDVIGDMDGDSIKVSSLKLAK